MQTDHNANGGRNASVSRRKLFQIAAASAVALPVAARAAAVAPKSPRLTADEATLVNAINRHTQVRARIDEISDLLTALCGRKDRPRYEFTVLEIVDRPLDYPPGLLNHEFRFMHMVDEFFAKRIAYCSHEMYAAQRARMQTDWERAKSLYGAREARWNKWHDDVGYTALEEEQDGCFDQMDALQATICGMPCSSARMVALKARFGAALLERTADEAGAYECRMMLSMLKSIVPACQEVESDR